MHAHARTHATPRSAEVHFVDAIPKNPSGKILRRVLKDKLLAAKKA